jgi:hypothetical protein
VSDSIVITKVREWEDYKDRLYLYIFFDNLTYLIYPKALQKIKTINSSRG